MHSHTPLDQPISSLQLFAGRDFAVPGGGILNLVQNQIFSAAQQMRNFSYLVGDSKTRECVVVDPAWDVKVKPGECVDITGVDRSHL
jgi:hypothetical protein